MNQIRETVQALLDAYALQLLQGTELEEDRQQDLLNRYQAEQHATLQAIMAVIDHARTDGIETLHLRLHDAPGVDHEMLDQAAAWAVEPREDGPALELTE